MKVIDEIKGNQYDMGPVCQALIDDLHLTTIPEPSCMVLLYLQTWLHSG